MYCAKFYSQTRRNFIQAKKKKEKKEGNTKSRKRQKVGYWMEKGNVEICCV